MVFYLPFLTMIDIVSLLCCSLTASYYFDSWFQYASFVSYYFVLVFGKIYHFQYNLSLSNSRAIWYAFLHVLQHKIFLREPLRKKSAKLYLNVSRWIVLKDKCWRHIRLGYVLLGDLFNVLFLNSSKIDWKAAASTSNKSKEPIKMKHNCLSYLFKLYYDLLLSDLSNISNNPGFESFTGQYWVYISSIVVLAVHSC